MRSKADTQSPRTVADENAIHSSCSLIGEAAQEPPEWVVGRQVMGHNVGGGATGGNWKSSLAPALRPVETPVGSRLLFRGSHPLWSF
ncbi:hypothetical protein GCM10023080_078950 [Streptomyces pseudoechinosporeus]